MYSRCEGYKNSDGKYIMFVDSDDWIDSKMIENLYNYIKEYKTDLVKCNYKFWDNNKILYNKKIVDLPTLIEKNKFEPNLYDILYNTAYCNCVWMQLIKKDALFEIDEIDKKLQYGEDLQINLLILKNVSSVLFVPDYLYNYRLNNESITNKIEYKSIKKKLIDSCDTYNVLYNYVEIFEIKQKDKYKEKSLVKLAEYFTSFSLKLFANIKCNDNIRKDIINLRNKNLKSENKKMIYNELKKQNIIFAMGFVLLMKKKLIYFEIYSKTVYKLTSFIFKKIRKIRG